MCVWERERACLHMMLISDHAESDKNRVSSSWTRQLAKCMVELLLRLTQVRSGEQVAVNGICCVNSFVLLSVGQNQQTIIIIVQFATFLSVVTWPYVTGSCWVSQWVQIFEIKIVCFHKSPSIDSQLHIKPLFYRVCAYSAVSLFLSNVHTTLPTEAYTLVFSLQPGGPIHNY